MAFCAPYVMLMKENAAQRAHSLRAVFNALRSWFVGMPLAHDSERFSTGLERLPADSAMDCRGLL
jgi:hypothetical protein